MYQSLKPKLFLAVQVLVVLTVCLWVRHEVLLGQTVSTDEGSYLFQSAAFRDGHLARPYPRLGSVFKRADDMIILDPDVGWVSRYSPGHALWLLPGTFLGWPYVMTLIAAGLSCVFLAKLGRELSAWKGTGWIVLCCPFFLVMHGTVMSHVSGFVMVLLLLRGYIRVQEEGALWNAGVAGLAWGLLFLNRSFSATLIAIPFGVDAVVQLIRRRDRRQLMVCLLFAGTALSGPLIYLLYNGLVTGDPRLPTYLVYEPTEGLGFGPRHLQGLPVNHTLQKGLTHTLENLLLLDRWIFGVPGGLILTLALAAWGFRRRWSPLLFAAPLCLMFGYVMFWFQGPRHIGPGYYFEALPFLAVAGLMGVGRLRDQIKRPWVKNLAWVGVCLLFIFSWSYMSGQRQFFREALAGQSLKWQVLSTAPDNSLIFLNQVDYPPFGKLPLNMDGPDSDPLVIYSRGSYNRYIEQAYPGRNVFRLDHPDQGLQPYDPYAESAPETLIWTADHLLHLTGTKEQVSGQVVLKAEEGRDAEGYLAYGKHPYLPPGHYEAVFRLEGSMAIPEGVYCDIAINGGRGQLAKLSGPFKPLEEIRLSFVIPETDFMRVEPRMVYGGKGAVALRSISIRFSEKAPVKD